MCSKESLLSAIIMAQQEVIALKSHKPDPLSTGLAESKFKDLYWSFVRRT